MAAISGAGQLLRGLGLPVLLGLTVTVMACQQQPLPGVDPTPPRTSPPPDSTPQTTVPQTVPAPARIDGTAIPGTVVQENTSDWISEGASPDQHQADLESCYAFANAQVRYDERINSDRGAIFNQSNSALAGNLYSYNKAMRPFASEQRFGELFSNCMSSRGYQQD